MSFKHSMTTGVVCLSLLGLLPTIGTAAETAETPTPAGSALLSQMVTGSFDVGTPDNLAGVLDYCAQNRLAEDSVETTGRELIETLGGRDDLAQQTGFASGQQGILVSEQDRRYTLEGADEATQRSLCDRLSSKARAAYLNSQS